MCSSSSEAPVVPVEDHLVQPSAACQVVPFAQLRRQRRLPEWRLVLVSARAANPFPDHT